jgi:hypothetical protein
VGATGTLVERVVCGELDFAASSQASPSPHYPHDTVYTSLRIFLHHGRNNEW